MSTGDLSLLPGSLYQVVIDGAGPGQFGTTSVTGTVDVTGAILVQPAGTYTPRPGEVFTIISNDGVDPVIGTFAGVPEGGLVPGTGPAALRVSYVGGDGNDVTLTAPALAPPAVVPVPTLSEWALMILAALVAGMGMLAHRRP